jgi:hypothetical protein
MGFLDVARRWTQEQGPDWSGETRAARSFDPLVVEATICAPEASAWRLYSRRLDRELWLVRDLEAAAELDRDGVRQGLPVVLAGDLSQLRSFDDQRLGDFLDLLAVFPGSRVAQLEPEAAS